MVYSKQLPAVRDLLGFAKEAHFPATREKLTAIAREEHLPDILIDFLNLFTADEIFTSKVDFMTKCEELEMIIDQERETPKEINRGP